MKPLSRLIAPVVALSLLSGCAAVTRVSGAAEPLNSFTLAPATYPNAPVGGSGHIVIEEASTSGALATDRILIKPSRVQAAYLPQSRWTDPAPVLVQTLLLSSLQNAGGFRLVARDAKGLQPDFTLMTELRDFQAEAPAGAAPVVKVGMTLTLIREADRRILATRRLDASAAAASDGTADVVVAFDTATSQILGQAVAWVQSNAR